MLFHIRDTHSQTWLIWFDLFTNEKTNNSDKKYITHNHQAVDVYKKFKICEVCLL